MYNQHYTWDAFHDNRLTNDRELDARDHQRELDEKNWKKEEETRIRIAQAKLARRMAG
jgi:hypothetical protein